MNKFLMTATLCLLTLPAFAAPTTQNTMQRDEGPTGHSFADHRDRLLRKLDEHITELQHREQCIRAATDKTALKACSANTNAHSSCAGMDKD